MESPIHIQPNNRLIAKNATLLTMRMAIVTIVGLYTSRVVFNQLGAVNYGVYGVVGGILGFMGFLTSAMAGASSRFITYAIGKGESSQINEIFSSSFIIHCAIAGIVIIVGETFGIWFLNNILSIPPECKDAAWWVFQFSIISSAVSITQVPYEAVIMAHEKMNIYAYMELVSVSLKLLIVYLLSIAPFDKLIVYSFLLLIVGITIAMAYRIYCIRKFPECRIKRPSNLSIIKSMLSFSFLDLYGNIGVTLNGQGLTYAINIFFGVVYNAAVSLASTVNGMVLSLTTTIAIAFKPQIVKQYAQGSIASMEAVMCNSIKFTLIATSMIAIPCAIEAVFVINLWLGEVPIYSTDFLRIIIIQSFFPIINNVCNAAIHANGSIKALTFINGSIFMFLPVVIFVAYHFGLGVLWGYVIEISGMILIISVAIGIIKKLIPNFNILGYIITIIKSFLIIIISVMPIIVIHYNMEMGFLRTATVTVCYAAVVGGLAWMFVLTRNNQTFVISKLKLVFSKI